MFVPFSVLLLHYILPHYFSTPSFSATHHPVDLFIFTPFVAICIFPPSFLLCHVTATPPTFCLVESIYVFLDSAYPILDLPLFILPYNLIPAIHTHLFYYIAFLPFVTYFCIYLLLPFLFSPHTFSSLSLLRFSLYFTTTILLLHFSFLSALLYIVFFMVFLFGFSLSMSALLRFAFIVQILRWCQFLSDDTVEYPFFNSYTLHIFYSLRYSVHSFMICWFFPLFHSLFWLIHRYYVAFSNFLVQVYIILFRIFLKHFILSLFYMMSSFLEFTIAVGWIFRFIFATTFLFVAIGILFYV